MTPRLQQACNKMIWMLKRLKCSFPIRSKLLLSILSFGIGYFFHYFLVLHKKVGLQTLEKGYYSQLVEYNDVEVLLVVLILSSINNLSKRDTLRETWLSGFSDSKEVNYYFVISLGSANDQQKRLISKEQATYNDLLIFHNLEDSFYLLTPKLVASFGWLTNTPVLKEEGESKIEKTFANFKFVLKCDDDSYVRLDKILQEIRTNYSGAEGKNLYWGFFDGRAKPKKSGKYKEDQWEICDYYIPYALGGGYVLAKPLVEFIARNGDYLKKYKSEDISVGAWLSSYSNLKRIHDTRFDTEYISRGCHHSYLITHKHSETAIRNFYNNIKTTGHLCQKEYKTRMSYVYNWLVVPSKCCPRNNPNIP